MRKIIVYSTKGKSGSFESDAKTWGEVQNDVRNIVGDLDNLIATENVNKTNLGHQDSVLPEGDFKIFLRPSKTKSGATDFSSMSFRECRAFIADKGQACKDYLNAEAKKSDRNWTQLSTEELQKYLSSYSGSKSSSRSSSKTSAKATKMLRVHAETEAAEEVSEEDLAREFNEIKKGFC